MDETARKEARDAFLLGSENPPKTAMSAEEWCDILEISRQTFYRRLRAAIKGGTLRYTESVLRVSSDGVRKAKVPLYQLCVKEKQ